MSNQELSLMTVSEVAERVRLSRARVHAIEQKALDKLAKGLPWDEFRKALEDSIELRSRGGKSVNNRMKARRLKHVGVETEKERNDSNW
jgi:transcriptional regulator